MNKTLIVLSGAGISAQSGIKTFRDSDGLWEGHDIQKVATPQGWNENAALVLDFYNQRRRQLLSCSPNKAHLALVQLETKYQVQIITQNVDDLHERAGSTNVLHLHGELLKARSTFNKSLIYPCKDDIHLGAKCEMGSQLRPHIVWFGEEIPHLEKAVELTSTADLILVIGTSLQVYPAAGLISYARKNIPVYYIDPKPALNFEMRQIKQLTTIPLPAEEGMYYLLSIL